MKNSFTYKSLKSGMLFIEFYSSIDTLLKTEINGYKKTLDIKLNSYYKLGFRIEKNIVNNISLFFDHKNYIDNTQISFHVQYFETDTLIYPLDTFINGSDKINLHFISGISTTAFDKMPKEMLLQRLLTSEYTLDQYKRSYGGPLKIANPLFRFIYKIWSIFMPRLGKLYQYISRDLDEIIIKTEPLPSHCPKISIVTPSYNQGQYLEFLFKSIEEQKYNNLEYIIQDNESDDCTKNVIEKYSHIFSSINIESDTGQANAINKGFKNATGEIMAWINSDDALAKDALNKVVKYFNENPNIDVIYGNRIIIDSENRHIGRWILPGHNNKSTYYCDFVPQETMFWRKSAWDKVGGFIDEGYNFALDWDLICRFQQKGLVIKHINYVLGYFRHHNEQKTSLEIDLSGFHEMNMIRTKYLGKHINNLTIKRKILFYLIKHVIADMITRIKIRTKMPI